MTRGYSQDGDPGHAQQVATVSAAAPELCSWGHPDGLPGPSGSSPLNERPAPVPGQEAPTTQRAWTPVLVRGQEVVQPQPPTQKVKARESRAPKSGVGAAPQPRSGPEEHGRPRPQRVRAHSGSLSSASSGRGGCVVTTRSFRSGPPPSPAADGARPGLGRPQQRRHQLCRGRPEACAWRREAANRPAAGPARPSACAHGPER